VNSDENIRKAFSKENSDKGLMMSLSDTFFFESGVARISEEAIPILEVEILLASKNKN
jgi:flagellar motor protein MotB